MQKRHEKTLHLFQTEKGWPKNWPKSALNCVEPQLNYYFATNLGNLLHCWNHAFALIQIQKDSPCGAPNSLHTNILNRHISPLPNGAFGNSTKIHEIRRTFGGDNSAFAESSWTPWTPRRLGHEEKPGGLTHATWPYQRTPCLETQKLGKWIWIISRLINPINPKIPYLHLQVS